MSQTIRMLPPSGVNGRTLHAVISANGRKYDPDAAPTVDAPHHDAMILSANGWTTLFLLGPTASRPGLVATSGNPVIASQGIGYFDTDLGKSIIFDGVQWRDTGTGLPA